MGRLLLYISKQLTCDCALWQLGMIQHVTDSHDFMDSRNKKDYYRVLFTPYSAAKVMAGSIEVKRDGLMGGLFSTRWFELDGINTNSLDVPIAGSMLDTAVAN